MSEKKRILFVTESHKLASGFGTYAKEVIPRIHATGKYEIAQLACYSSPKEFKDTDWLIYGVAPMQGETNYEENHKNTVIQWGLGRFEHACLDFKPDIVVTWRDPWMDAYISDSPFLPFFHWVWMPTVDSEPQKNEWLYIFDKCDGLLAYSEYGIKVLSEQTNGRIKPVDCASPAIDPEVFNIIPNKQKHKQNYGLDPDSFIVGTIMRNQKRKMFPELMKAFKEFLEKAPESIAKKSYLYIHTSHPEKSGWDITSLIHEYGIGSRVLATYTCRMCKEYFVSHYRDALTVCDHCGRHSATLPGVSSGIEHKELANIYNLMDLYVQYAICEGFGMPQVEAAACGVPIASIDYSAMEDIVRQTNGYPIKAHLERELETNADRARANNRDLIDIMISCSSQTESQKKKQRLDTRLGCIKRYTWDNAAKAWEDYFDGVKKSKLMGQWEYPALHKPIPENAPKNLTNYQFAEWVCVNVLQDESYAFNYKMLSMVRDLNFGASYGLGKLEDCSQQSIFNENKFIGDRKYSFDAIRANKSQAAQNFILEAHKRIKK